MSRQPKPVNHQPNAQPWHRQSDESEKAYEAFEIYLNLRENRTNADVATALGKSYFLIQKWKNKYDWDSRVLAYDNWERSNRDLSQAAAQSELIHKREKEWQERRDQIRRAEYEIGQRFVEIGKKHLDRYETLLKFPVVEEKHEGEAVTKADGTVSAQTIILKPLAHRVADPIKAIDTGLKLMRQSAEMPNPGVVPMPTTPTLQDDLKDTTRLTPEELDAERARLEEEEAEIRRLIAERDALAATPLS